MTSIKCEVCARIGAFLSVDNQEGQKLPAEIDDFEIVLHSYYGYWVLRCPRCGTYFKQERYVDNEIGCGYNVEELEELTPQRAAELVKFEKATQKRLAQEARQRPRQ